MIWEKGEMREIKNHEKYVCGIAILIQIRG